IGEWENATQPGPRVAVVQTNREQDNRVVPTPADTANEWSALVDLHRQAVRGDGDGEPPSLVVWPETIVPAPLNAAGIARMREVAAVSLYVGETEEEAADRRARYGLQAQFGNVVPEVVRAGGVATIVGASGLEVTPEFSRTNSAYLVTPGGTIEPTAYHKQHRVPMGEYIPGPGFVETLIAWMSPWQSSYELTPGTGPVVFTLPGGWQVGTPICYEDAIAGVCREMVYAGEGKRLDLLVNLTNDGWYPGRGMRRQHAQLASLRCIENRVPMARSVNTGISAAIDSLGRSSARLNEYEAGVLTHTVRVDQRSTVYGTVGGWPWVLFVIFAMGASMFAAVFGRPLAKHRIA
ncbi:MAG: apolipoprotein N-acyltransferase, partial [Planctomycetota bacterium]